MVGSCEVFRSALRIRGNAIVCVLHHLCGDGEFLHKLNVLDKLRVGLSYAVTLGGVALLGSSEYVEFVLTYDGLTEAVALLNVEKIAAYAALLGKKIALVLDYHLDGSLELADSGRVKIA